MKDCLLILECLLILKKYVIILCENQVKTKWYYNKRIKKKCYNLMWKPSKN
jgi:hypothetical protein